MTRSLLLFVSALVLATCPAMASTYYVGTCHTKSFPSISAAVSAVPAGSVIDVCPGNYVEQVIISKSLTLQGITSQNSLGSEIASFSGSVAESQVLGLDLNPAIWVTAGTVNISNLLVVSGADISSCSQFPTGIFYASGTSGTMDHVDVEVASAGCGAGIVAENDLALSSSIKIENSYIDSDNFGILMGSQQPEGVLPVLLNTITGNTITALTHGMLLLQSRGKVSGNNIVGSDPKENISYGILDAAPATAITDNSISGIYSGIIIDGASATVTGNRLNVSGIGIDLGCTLGTVTGNTIVAYHIGLNHTPATFTGKNIFMIAGQLISGGC
jgi:hypothetical protein